MDWKKLWEAKGEKNSDDISSNGFDSHGSKIDDFYEFRRKICKFVKDNSNIEKGNILEVGCGNGSLINQMSKYFVNSKMYGVDYSSGLLNAAITKYKEKDIEFIKCSANKMPFANESFNLVYVFSVFQYFGDINFAKKTVEECLRILKVGSKLLIMDIPDIFQKEKSEAARKIPSEHLYYDRNFFISNFNGEILENEIKEYENSKFRFNVLITKD
jgi:ubiquinone/menaquinone biosynthesis C-methylase UbiE